MCTLTFSLCKLLLKFVLYSYFYKPGFDRREPSAYSPFTSRYMVHMQTLRILSCLYNIMYKINIILKYLFLTGAVLKAVGKTSEGR